MTYTRMPDDRRNELVAALRSGEFRQAKHSLRTSTGYCCLGVSCELYRRNTGGKADWKGVYGSSLIVFEGESGRNDLYLIPEVATYFGLNSLGQLYCDADVAYEFLRAFPAYNYNNGIISLANMNDQGFTFDEIANAIEMFW